MLGMKKKATPSGKPKVPGLKKMNLDKTAGTVKGLKQSNLDKPLKPKAKPTATKKPKPTPSPKPKLGPLPKNPTLNDYLIRGIRPPVKGKTPPPDYDVIIKGFNDKKTINKYKKK